MPRNRRPLDREEKRREIVNAAVALFSEDGFERTSMARVAAAAGVTPNTIYWYVEDKDALLVAALDQLLAEALQDFGDRASLPLADQVMWVLERLQRHRALISVVHARSERATVVAQWHDQFHAFMDGIVTEHLAAQGVSDPERHARVKLTTFAVEGLLAHPSDAASSRAILDLVVTPEDAGG